jgi:ferric iron reductase protein FhuF
MVLFSMKKLSLLLLTSSITLMWMSLSFTTRISGRIIWNHYWFYHSVEVDEMPFVCSQISNFPKGVGTAYEEGDPD